MPDDVQPEANPSPSEQYTVGYNAPVQGFFGSRGSEQFAGFLLPHLRPGMSLLDVGSGPGSITIGLASALAPGEVVGVDISEAQIEMARETASKSALTNIRFEVGSTYQLPLPDTSFDAIFSSHMLHHLSEPLRALAEFRRVLKPGGVVGVIDPDWGSWLLEPSTPLLERYLQLHLRVQEHNGGDYRMARHHRHLLAEAGFERVVGSAVANCMGTEEGTRLRASVIVDRVTDPAFVDIAIRNGWSNADELAAMANDARAWGDHPQAFWSVTACSAVGWVPPR